MRYNFRNESFTSFGPVLADLGGQNGLKFTEKIKKLLKRAP